jgi:hypothetical protein
MKTEIMAPRAHFAGLKKCGRKEKFFRPSEAFMVLAAFPWFHSAAENGF